MTSLLLCYRRASQKTVPSKLWSVCRFVVFHIGRGSAVCLDDCFSGSLYGCTNASKLKLTFVCCAIFRVFAWSGVRANLINSSKGCFLFRSLRLQHRLKRSETNFDSNAAPVPMIQTKYACCLFVVHRAFFCLRASWSAGGF